MTDELLDLKHEYALAQLELKITKRIFYVVGNTLSQEKRDELGEAMRECYAKIDVLANKIEAALKK